MTTMITCRPEHSGLSRRRPTRGKMSMGSLLIPPRLVVPAIVLLLVPLTARGQGDPARARAAAVRALPLLQRSARTFAEARSGVSGLDISTAVQAIRAYMPAELASERDRTVRRAAAWLRSNRPRSTEDAAFKLIGLASAGASADDLQRASVDLVALQRPDGGWPQIPGYQSDAYSTGEALVALHDAGGSAGDRASVRGVAFLISSQAGDGTWRVRTRMISPAEVSPMYFATGFPYGKDEFLSFTGSCWAVMGLLSSLPDAPIEDIATTPAEAAVMPAWVRTA